MAFCQHSSPDSALRAAMHPDFVPLDTLLLASIEFSQRWLKWTKTEDASKKPPRNEPKPLPILAPPEPVNQYVPMTIDEMDDFLKSPRE